MLDDKHVPCVLSGSFSWICRNLIRLIEVEDSLFWNSEIVTRMQWTKPRSTMILQWSIYLMFSSFLLPALLSIHSRMRSTRAGILGYCRLSQAACTCLVCHFSCAFVGTELHCISRCCDCHSIYVLSLLCGIKSFKHSFYGRVSAKSKYSFKNNFLLLAVLLYFIWL